MPSKVRFRNWNANGVVTNVGDYVERVFVNIGNRVRNTAVKKLNKGQRVRRSRGGRLIGLEPSKAGEPPRTLTGRLKQSVTFVIERSKRRIVLRIGTNVVYGRRLELGFFGRDKKGRHYNQAARPWLRPSLVENIKWIGMLLKRGPR